MERQRFGVARLPLRRVRGALSEATPAELEVVEAVYASIRLGSQEDGGSTEVRWKAGGSTVPGGKVSAAA